LPLLFKEKPVPLVIVNDYDFHPIPALKILKRQSMKMVGVKYVVIILIAYDSVSWKTIRFENHIEYKSQRNREPKNRL